MTKCRQTDMDPCGGLASRRLNPGGISAEMLAVSFDTYHATAGHPLSVGCCPIVASISRTSLSDHLAHSVVHGTNERHTDYDEHNPTDSGRVGLAESQPGDRF